MSSAESGSRLVSQLVNVATTEAEGDADDDRDRQVDQVAAQDEVSEAGDGCPPRDYATIQLRLQTSQSAIVPASPSRWDTGLDRAGEILALEAMIVLYALVIVGPLLVLGLLTWLGRRGLRRREEERILAAK